jgi:hypothetical protein
MADVIGPPIMTGITVVAPSITVVSLEMVRRSAGAAPAVLLGLEELGALLGGIDGLVEGTGFTVDAPFESAV